MSFALRSTLMFATLLGALPRWPIEGASTDDHLRAAVRAQEDAGLEPITDGRLGDPTFDRLGDALADGSAVQVVVDRWRLTAALTDRAVKQALPGPYSLGRRVGPPDAAAKPDRAARTMTIADALHRVIAALAAAGCPLVEIEETYAHRIGADEGERRLFREAHRRVTDGNQGTHLSLSIVGGSADDAGLETILDAPYPSLAVDLIAGPDNWNLVTRLAGERGVIAGVESARDEDEPKEVLLWAARYAASTRGRGLDRVGLGSAGSYANLTWDAADRKMRLLAEAARLASTPGGDELAASLDPLAVSARAAALGTTARPTRKSGRGGGGRPGRRT